MTGEGPHPAPDMWGILDKMAASVNIIAITAATWGLRGEGVKGVAGSRVVVFSRVGGWEGDMVPFTEARQPGRAAAS